MSAKRLVNELPHNCRTTKFKTSSSILILRTTENTKGGSFGLHAPATGQAAATLEELLSGPAASVLNNASLAAAKQIQLIAAQTTRTDR